MPKRKSLAEELAELANPAPTKEIDPELDLFGAGPVLEASDDELPAVTKSKGKERPRLRGDIALNSKEYSGKRSSRKDFFEDEEDDAAGLLSEAASSDNDDLEDASEEEGSEDELMDGVDEDDSGDDDQQSEGDEEGSDGGDDEGQHMGNGLHAREVRGQSSDDGDETEDDAAALEREYRAVQEEEALAVAGLQERAVKEKKKAVAVRAQCSIWNAGLEMRILMQKALQGANKLPQPESHRVAVALDESLASGLAGLSADALSTLEELLALLEALAEQNPALRQAQEAAGVAGRHQDELGEDDEGAKVDRAWALLDGAYQRFAPYRDASIDRWHRKTVLSSGGAARGSLKVLNQSISSQVQLLMRDTERVVQRAQLAKRQRTVLCAISDESATSSEDEGAEATDLAIKDEERDPETYDDSEFYQTLLKEFLEEKQDSAGVNWYTGPKQRKLVDRRASKGRKLRYHIHEKLVNFMAPVELEAPLYAANVFSNLFGGATLK